jgi:hypothetical protein
LFLIISKFIAIVAQNKWFMVKKYNILCLNSNNYQVLHFVIWNQIVVFIGIKIA